MVKGVARARGCEERMGRGHSHMGTIVCYYTNWPVGHERRSNNIHSGVVRNNSDNNINKQSEGIQTTPEKD